MAADTNKHGRVTWIDAIEYIKSLPNYARTLESEFGPRIRHMLALAPMTGPPSRFQRSKRSPRGCSAASIRITTARYPSTRSRPIADQPLNLDGATRHRRRDLYRSPYRKP